MTVIAVVGGANLDITARASQALIQGDSTPGILSMAAGGVARNIAENLARLGCSTHLFSAVGDDAMGERVLKQSRSAGVDVNGVAVITGASTSSYLSVHATDGDMIHAVNDMRILNQYSVSAFVESANGLLAADALVVDTNLEPATLEAAVSHWPATPIYADAVSVAKCQRLAPWLHRLHVLKVNLIEAASLCEEDAIVVQNPEQMARFLHQKGVANVVISLGAQGVAWCDASGITGFRASRAVTAVSTSGAGDALLAGIVQAVVAGEPLGTAVAFGMACAEITLLSPFANAPELSVYGARQRMLLEGVAS